MNDAVKNRYWDNLWAIIISFAVLGGYLWGYYAFDYYVQNAVNVIFIFLAPAAAFAAGRSARADEWRRSQLLKRYIVAYAVFNAAMIFVQLIVTGERISFLVPAYSFWFILALIIWSALAQYADRIKLLIPFAFAVALFIGFWPEIDGTLAIVQTISYFPFFMIGYKLSPKIEHWLSVEKKTWFCLVGAVAFVGFAAAAVLLGRYITLDTTQLLRLAYDGYRVLAVRAVFCVIALGAIVSLLLLTSRRQMFAFSTLGANAPAVFLGYKFFILIFQLVLPASGFGKLYYLFIILAVVATLIVLGLPPVSKALNAMLSFFVSLASPGHKKKLLTVARVALALLLVGILALPLGLKLIDYTGGRSGSERSGDYIAPELAVGDVSDSDVVIAYIGDMILLQDQVRDAYNSDKDEYDFNEVFEYASPYLRGADYAVGVLEGPLAGADVGYSSSNFDDAIPMYLNFPDSFAAAARDAGIDLVTSATNHLLDKGSAGAARTADALAELGLVSTGVYKSAEDKKANAVKLVEINGLKVAFLSYTYGMNYYDEQQLNGELSYVSSFLASPTSVYFSGCKKAVIADIEAAEKLSPDCIIVMAHMGEQFMHETSNYQNVWNDIFVSAGADVVLGDHSHAVQPVEFVEDSVVVNCPGNFANLYREYDGDAGAIVELRLDAASGRVKSAAVVPMWTTRSLGGQYQAVPVSTLLGDAELRAQLSEYELERISEVNSVVTKTMLGVELSLDQLQNRYYLVGGEYRRQPVAALENASTDNALIALLDDVSSVCFVGDSITAGTKNNGYGWYEPLAEMFPGLEVSRAAWGSATTKTLLARENEIAANRSELFVISIGTNDVRYRNDESAKTSEAYIDNLTELVGTIVVQNPNAKFAFVTPWISMVDDPNREQSHADCRASHYEYGDALKAYCDANGYLCLDPQPMLELVLETDTTSDYLVDYIHPNAGAGLRLYSEAVLKSADSTVAD